MITTMLAGRWSRHETLLERETVDGTDVDEVLGRIPGRPQPIGATGHTTTVPAEDPATTAGR